VLGLVEAGGLLLRGGAQQAHPQGLTFVHFQLNLSTFGTPAWLKLGHAAHQAAEVDQGLTLVHISAQRKRFVWDRGAFRDCAGGV
jgi:hypothetical protein